MDMPRQITDDPAAIEALSRVEIVYTDLDGTLLAKGGCLLADAQGRPSTMVAEAVVEANRAGVHIVPISGRGRLQLIEFVRLLGWCDFIAEAGAVLVRGVGAGQHVFYNNAEWPEALLAEGLTPFELIERSGAYELLRDEFPGRIEYHDPWHLDREATHLLRGCVNAADAQAVLDRIALPIGLLDNGLVRNKGTLTCADDEFPHAYHLVPKGVSKAQAISLDLAARGLSPDQAAAIGDSATDIEMADAVGTMVLVHNAFDSLGVRTILAESPRANVLATCCERGEGWAEFVRVWLSARAER